MNTTEYGVPFPLGASKVPSGWNFAVYSHSPVTQIVFAPLHNPDDVTTLALDPEKNRSGFIWHIFVPSSDTELLYGYKVTLDSAVQDAKTMQGLESESFLMGGEHSQKVKAPTIKSDSDSRDCVDLASSTAESRGNNDLLIDPYAKLINSGCTWKSNAFSDNSYKTRPLGVAFARDTFNWGNDKAPFHLLSDLLIYEMHLRGLTMEASSHAHNPGSYLGVIEKIPYFKQLGINAIEFLPIFEFDESDCINFNPKTKMSLCNYWGYQPLSFFSPMQRYATSNDPLEGLHQCKEMIKSLHEANIEVILDIVFNHTGEGNQLGRTISWKGFSENDYYIKDTNGEYLNYSGCGNTLNCNHPIVADMIIESLRYWVTELHVDGFRFDLASILMRGQDGEVLESSPLLDRITQDGILSRTKLIAEPWDAAGLHQVGQFFQTSWNGPEQWMEWNDNYRTVVREFIKGSKDFTGKFATKLCGSQDLYGVDGSPLNSINYVSCHDGFTVRDLVSYEHKHNLNNGEDNRDGINQFDTWNCGHEGCTNDHQIEVLRQRQMKNFCVALLVSCGIPMIGSGDEYGHTKHGNNNTWCQDNSLSWFQWQELTASSSLLHFWKSMIRFRQETPCLRRKTFYTPEDIQWHGHMPNAPDWSVHSHFVAFTVIDHGKRNDIYVAFNACNSVAAILLPQPPSDKQWALVADTALLPPLEISEEATHNIIDTNELQMEPFSSLILKAV